MTWNIRVVKYLYDTEPCLQLAEVFYNEHGKPYGWCPANASGETIDELHDYIDRMKEALAYPIVEFKE